MMMTMDSNVDLTFKDKIHEIEEGFEGEWITVFSRTEDGYETHYCALIRESHIEQSLNDTSWDLQIGRGGPGIVSSWKDGKSITSYYRFSNEEVEPLIIKRNFHGIQDSYWDISEEFRLYHNIFEDKKKGKFYLFDEDGDEEEVIKIENRRIVIKSKYLKEFAALKKMRLVIFFDYTRFSTHSLEELNLTEYPNLRHEKEFCYSIGAQKWSFSDDWKTHGWLMGKRLIQGLDDFEPDIFGNKTKVYEEFIIDVDKDGNPIKFTCDVSKLANYFGKNEGSPYVTTPVIFKKDVLTKYYSQPRKYTIGDGNLHCDGLWSIRIDNNNQDFVMVFLYDLGKLSHKEQLYWKSFNIAQKGTISHTAWERGFEAKFTDPEKSDLYFKHKFISFKEKWNKKYGWNLFRDLPKEDEYHLKTLRIPLTNEQKEFDEQILSLTKIMIDSLNEKELKKELEIYANMKGIDKLELFLESKGKPIPDLIKYLRNLQDIRSRGVAHLKGKNYQKLKKALKMDEKELTEVFDLILIDAVVTLNTLEKYFL